ncbi:MAG: hypothetical protein JWL70_568 [Acidimicrobiia bacterium]|nr:hypothetical protein [Acidimicrobiia bacterium]
MPGNVRPVSCERDGLMAFLGQQRQVLRLTAYGLTDEQARITLPGGLSVGGLIKHLASGEESWMDIVLQRTSPPSEATGSEETDYTAGFRLEAHESLATVLERYERAAANTDAVIAAIDDLGLAVPVPQGVPWFPADIEAWSVRWVLLHLIEETARHAGHADIVRESIDGATAFPLMAAAEGWPETPWMTPWKPATAS